eukprot:CAMPEP_0194519914 /NCGR_PEP_ID=MMETSP0253-20130528/53719_1 /TAXON_ID=2966 /ORGANISM="Noctiluca scintillans" /LENGTH=117 /DNA_ID=CAMNT_0039364091 /DNA_START=230 /DNA_END=583 /DNA_ORIENTATION=-
MSRCLDAFDAPEKARRTTSREHPAEPLEPRQGLHVIGWIRAAPLERLLAFLLVSLFLAPPHEEADARHEHVGRKPNQPELQPGHYQRQHDRGDLAVLGREEAHNTEDDARDDRRPQE